MEPPKKRQRISGGPYNEDDEDEICMEPGEFAVKQDPGYQLDKSRAVAAFKLKSSFEHIFEKYERDFTDVGDEIDLNTGEIVVDNGHLRSMGEGEDAGETMAQHVLESPAQPNSIEISHADEASSDEEERILHGGREEKSLMPRPRAVVARPLGYNERRHVVGGWSNMASLVGGGGRLSSIFPTQPPFMGNPLSFGSFGYPNDMVDPAWRAPELPMPLFTNGYQSHHGNGLPRVVPTRTITRKSLPIPRGDVDKDDDDILLGTTANQAGKGSPKEKDAERSGIKDITESFNETGAARLRSSKFPKKRPEPSQAKSSLQRSSVKQPAKRRRDALDDSGMAAKEVTKGSAKAGAVPEREHSPAKSVKRRPGRPRGVVVQETVQETTLAPKSRKGRRSSGNATTSPQDELTNGSAVTRSRDPALSTVSDEGKQMVIASRGKQHHIRAVEAARTSLDGSQRRSSRSIRQTGSHSVSPRVDTSWVATQQSSRKRLVVEIVERRPSPSVTKFMMVDFEETVEVAQTQLEDAGSKLPRDETNAPASSGTSSEAIPDSQKQTSESPLVQPDTSTQKQCQQTSSEVYSRNVVDPAYAFSDEDNGLIMRKPLNMNKPKRRGRISGASVTAPVEKGHHEETSDAVTGSIDAGDEEQASMAIQDASVLQKTPEVAPKSLKKTASSKTKRYTSVTRATRRKRLSKEAPNNAATDTHPSPASPTLSKFKNENKAPIEQSPTPKTPQNKNKSSLSATHPPPSKDGIISLVSDSEEDELSLGPHDFTPGGSRRSKSSHEPSKPSSGSMRKSALNRLLLSSHSKSTPTLGTSHISPAISSAGSKKRHSAKGSTRFLLPHREKSGSLQPSRATSPTGSLIRTPGGTMRRCGVDGFKCDRDFCFICL